MKQVLIIICFLVASCGNSRNELMTKLINEKKSVNDSLSKYENEESRKTFVYDTVIITRAPIDVILKNDKMKREIAAYYAPIKKIFTDRLAAIDYSIDSLQKMK